MDSDEEDENEFITTPAYQTLLPPPTTFQEWDSNEDADDEYDPLSSRQRYRLMIYLRNDIELTML